MKLAMVCDGKRTLVAVVTDGDIRRHFIRGGTVDEPISRAYTANFVKIAKDIPRPEALRLMISKHITCLPVVDEAGRLIDVHFQDTAIKVGSDCKSWAMIMAGGKGERLGELTNAIPKPMLLIGDRPILELIVQLLVSHGIRRIFISVNYLGKMIEGHFGDGSGHNCRIEYVHGEEPCASAPAAPWRCCPRRRPAR